jgi:hypothetical protein
LLRVIVARIFWLIQSEETKNLAQPQNWPSINRNVSLEKRQTDRLALTYILPPKVFPFAKGILPVRSTVYGISGLNQRSKYSDERTFKGV